MKTRVVAAIAACVAALGIPAANAADAATAAKPRSPGTNPAPATVIEEIELGRSGEPVVKRTIIDDGRARIEELRVRGQLQKVTVEPKGRVPGYEILLGDGAHVVGDDPGTSRGSAGKRVWNVLRF